MFFDAISDAEGEERNCTEVIDTRKWRNAEQTLRSYEQHLKTIFDHTSEGYVLVDHAFRILAFNQKAGVLIFRHGKAGELRNGHSLFDYLPENRQEPFRVMGQQVLSGGPVTYQQAYPLPGGGERWFAFTVSPVREDGRNAGLCISGRDVSAQVVAEQAMIAARQEAERSEQKYRKIFDQSPIPKWIYDLETLRILEVNSEAVRHYGYSREEFLSMTIRELRPAGEQQALSEALKVISDGRKDSQFHHGYWRHRKKNGEIMIVDITGHAVEIGEQLARMVICQDVTARVEAEASLLRSNERFGYAVRATSDAIWDWDIGAETVFLGKGFRSLFGYAQAGDTVPRQWIMDKLHPEDQARVGENIQATITSRNYRWSDEYRFEKADGSYAIICNTALLLRGEHGQPSRLIGAIRDVTERRLQLEAIRTQNEQLREIAWYQSHIVRAPLARLLGLTELMRLEQDAGSLRDIIPMLRTTAEELDGIIRSTVDKTRHIDL